jgi:CO/xanthine dehydrogenase Mo-binding subunit
MPASDARPRWASRPTRIREDRRFVTGRGRYVADITPPGTLHVGLVTSPYPHARIVSIDPAEAMELDGVACVLTGAELAKVTEPLRQYLPLPAPARPGLPAVQWRPLAVAEARYAGEWVAAVVASSRAVAEDAAELVNVDYEPLDAVLDPETALGDGAPLVHTALGSNVLAHREFSWGDVAGDFARADSVSRVRVRWNRSSTVPLETFGVVASWDDDARLLDVWASVQMPQFPEQLARALRLAGNQVRVHFDVDVGGSYGVKRGIKHAVLAGHLSTLLHAPVKLIEDRAENMHGGDFHGPDRIFDVELACTADGDFTSIKIAVIDDEGAFPGRSPLQLAKPIGAIVGPYRIGSAAYTATAVATNKTGQVAVRGFGQAPTNYAIESAVDAAAQLHPAPRVPLPDPERHRVRLGRLPGRAGQAHRHRRDTGPAGARRAGAAPRRPARSRETGRHRRGHLPGTERRQRDLRERHEPRQRQDHVPRGLPAAGRRGRRGHRDRLDRVGRAGPRDHGGHPGRRGTRPRPGFDHGGAGGLADRHAVAEPGRQPDDDRARRGRPWRGGRAETQAAPYRRAQPRRRR